jgi:DNA-binding response OmpR family regulator
MRILFVEDDQALAITLHKFLREQFDVENAYTGKEALNMIKERPYDLVLLDYTLPDTTAPELYREIQAIDDQLKVLLLTGNDNLDDKITMLDAGAEDYITKPFALGELMARIRASLRRPVATAESSVLSAGQLELDTSSREVKRAGKHIRLRRKDFNILEYLLRNKGRVVTRGMILDNVWDGSRESSTNIVDVHIKYLRDLVDKPFSSPLIHTISGVGYKLDTSRPMVTGEQKEGGDSE